MWTNRPSFVLAPARRNLPRQGDGAQDHLGGRVRQQGRVQPLDALAKDA